MELKVFEAPGEEWDDFISRYTDLIFYRSVWSQVLKRGLGGQPLYFCLEEGNEIVAGLPGILLDFRIFKIFYASIPYGNLVGGKPFFPTLMDLVEREFQKKGIDQIRITESPFFESHRPEGYKPVSARVSLLDLRHADQEKVWKGYKKYIRRDVRKAERSGVTIHSGNSAKEIKAFYDLYLASMERNRTVAKYPFRWFKALCEGEPGKSLATIRLAVLNQSAIAGLVLIHSATTTHYFHSGSRSQFLKYCPNELLVHRSIEEAIGQRVSCFDFMGSDRTDLNLIRFKEKWGSQSLDVCTYIKDYHVVKSKIWDLGKKMATSDLGSKAARWVRGRRGFGGKD